LLVAFRSLAVYPLGHDTQAPPLKYWPLSQEVASYFAVNVLFSKYFQVKLAPGVTTVLVPDIVHPTNWCFDGAVQELLFGE